MNTQQRAVVQQALEALESLFSMKADDTRGQRCSDAVVALRQLLEQPAAWVGFTREEFIDLCEDASNFGTGSLIRHIEAKLREKNGGGV